MYFSVIIECYPHTIYNKDSLSNLLPPAFDSLMVYLLIFYQKKKFISHERQNKIKEDRIRPFCKTKKVL